jgi:hypothetical protein
MRKSARVAENLDKWSAYPEIVEALKRTSKTSLKIANSRRKKEVKTLKIQTDSLPPDLT